MPPNYRPWIVCFVLSIFFLWAWLLPGQAGTQSSQTILILGDSLTEGLDLNPDEAYPARWL